MFKILMVMNVYSFVVFFGYTQFVAPSLNLPNVGYFDCLGMVITVLYVRSYKLFVSSTFCGVPAIVTCVIVLVILYAVKWLSVNYVWML